MALPTHALSPQLPYGSLRHLARAACVSATDSRRGSPGTRPAVNLLSKISYTGSCRSGRPVPAPARSLPFRAALAAASADQQGSPSLAPLKWSTAFLIEKVSAAQKAVNQICDAGLREPPLPIPRVPARPGGFRGRIRRARGTRSHGGHLSAGLPALGGPRSRRGLGGRRSLLAWSAAGRSAAARQPAWSHSSPGRIRPVPGGTRNARLDAHCATGSFGCAGLTKAHSGAFLSNLASALGDQARCLAELGRPEEALSVAKQATDLYRQLG